MTSLLPLQPMEGARRPVILAIGEHAARLPRRVAETITDIRFPGEHGLEGKSARTGEWGCLLSLKVPAERLGPVELETLIAEGDA